ncbi:hypothetical protein AVEN_154212-1, partial [Araneus ventricosus]
TLTLRFFGGIEFRTLHPRGRDPTTRPSPPRPDPALPFPNFRVPSSGGRLTLDVTFNVHQIHLQDESSL